MRPNDKACMLTSTCPAAAALITSKDNPIIRFIKFNYFDDRQTSHRFF